MGRVTHSGESDRLTKWWSWSSTKKWPISENENSHKFSCVISLPVQMVIIFCSKATFLIIHVQMCALLVLLGSLAKELTLMLIAVTFKCTLYSTQHSDQRQRMYSAVYWGCARYHWSFDLWWWCKIQRLKSYATTCAIKQNYWPRGPLSTQFCAENGPLLTRWASPGGSVGWKYI